MAEQRIAWAITGAGHLLTESADTVLQYANVDVFLSRAAEEVIDFLELEAVRHQTVGGLPYGIRKKIEIGRALASGPDLLLLDEPTNHLDIPAQEILQQVLDAYKGTILLVTHDRYLIDALATQIWEIGGMRQTSEFSKNSEVLNVYKGTYSQMRAERDKEAERARIEVATVKKTSGSARSSRRDPAAKEKRRRKARLQEVENKVATLEKKLAELEKQLETPPEDAEELRKLAEEYLGSKDRWREFLKVNIISDPELIMPGERLYVPILPREAPVSNGHPAMLILQPTEDDTPEIDVNPVMTEHLIVVRTIDSRGNPVPNVRVEWVLSDFPSSTGDIIEADDNGKINNRYAVTYTNRDPVKMSVLVMTGVTEINHFGVSCFAGDHNGDGYDDILVGAHNYASHGAAHLVLGPSSGAMSLSSADAIIESVDIFPTLCELADVPPPEGMDGRSIVPEVEGSGAGRPWAICEWDFPPPQRRVNAIRTDRYRLVYYSHELGGELYDHATDPYEMRNVWDDPEYRETRLELLELLFDQVNLYSRKSDFDNDHRLDEYNALSPTRLIHKKCRKWSEFEGFLE